MGKKALSLDALLLLTLVLVRVRIDTLVMAVIPRPADLVAQVPILGGLLSPDARRLLTDPMADPVSRMLIAATFGLTLVYLLLDAWENWPGRLSGLGFYRAKLVTLYLIIFTITGVSTLLVIGLRHVSEPARYAHDGGVLITESAIHYLLDGKNPYVETYRGTPVEKAYPDGPGLSSYAYLPWAFLSGVPFYAASQAILGWYDQRFVYLIALALTLALVPRLAAHPREKLIVVMFVGLNPIMGNDIVYGMNDILVVCWLVMAAWLLKADRGALSAGAMGLALATKGTVWPILPFYLLCLFRRDLPALPKVRLSSLRKLVPLIVVTLVVVLPFALWNPGALVEDTWSYNLGVAGGDPLPIRGWGIANLVLAFGWVRETTDYFPFGLFGALFVLPVLLILLLRQWRRNTVSGLLLNYGLFFLVLVFFSRTMNANYIGFALAFSAIGYFGDDSSD